MNFSQRVITPTAPIKGSFPLDHKGDCTETMVDYFHCMEKKDSKNELCRDYAKAYFECRMNNNLMAKEDWSKLGFDNPPTTTGMK